MPRTDTSKSQATNRTSRMPQPGTNKSDVTRKIRALGSASCDITHETGDTSRHITHEPRARYVAVLIVCWHTKTQLVCDSFLTLKTLQLSKQDEFLQDRCIL